jgi:hypothetical protein
MGFAASRRRLSNASRCLNAAFLRVAGKQFTGEVLSREAERRALARSGTASAGEALNPMANSVKRDLRLATDF